MEYDPSKHIRIGGGMLYKATVHAKLETRTGSSTLSQSYIVDTDARHQAREMASWLFARQHTNTRGRVEWCERDIEVHDYEAAHQEVMF
jgi:hypothetical protein